MVLVQMVVLMVVNVVAARGNEESEMFTKKVFDRASGYRIYKSHLILLMYL